LWKVSSEITSWKTTSYLRSPPWKGQQYEIPIWKKATCLEKPPWVRPSTGENTTWKKVAVLDNLLEGRSTISNHHMGGCWKSSCCRKSPAGRRRSSITACGKSNSLRSLIGKSQLFEKTIKRRPTILNQPMAKTGCLRSPPPRRRQAY
jgi:hypothetical protein